MIPKLKAEQICRDSHHDSKGRKCPIAWANFYLGDNDWDFICTMQSILDERGIDESIPTFAMTHTAQESADLFNAARAKVLAERNRKDGV